MINIILWGVGLITTLLILSWIAIMAGMIVLIGSSGICYRIGQIIGEGRPRSALMWLSKMYRNAANRYEARIQPLMKYHPIERIVNL